MLAREHASLCAHTACGRSGSAVGIAMHPLLPPGWGRCSEVCGSSSSNFWSGSPNANNSDNAWNVNFNNGNANNNNRDNNNHVRAVRGGE